MTIWSQYEAIPDPGEYIAIYNRKTNSHKIAVILVEIYNLTYFLYKISPVFIGVIIQRIQPLQIINFLYDKL